LRPDPRQFVPLDGAAHFGKTYHPSSMTRVLRRLGFSRQKARPAHPQRDAKAQERFQKRGSGQR